MERSSVEFPYLYRTRIDPDVGILEASGDTAKANKILTVMKGPAATTRSRIQWVRGLLILAKASDGTGESRADQDRN